MVHQLFASAPPGLLPKRGNQFSKKGAAKKISLQDIFTAHPKIYRTEE
jgi:hypothetical protein